MSSVPYRKPALRFVTAMTIALGSPHRMRKWRRPGSGGGSPPGIPASPPEDTEEVQLPDPKEAEQAIRQQLATRRRVDELHDDVHAWIEFLREAREENHFADGIVAMVKEGR